MEVRIGKMISFYVQSKAEKNSRKSGEIWKLRCRTRKISAAASPWRGAPILLAADNLRVREFVKTRVEINLKPEKRTIGSNNRENLQFLMFFR